jgi:hypothetical protein
LPSRLADLIAEIEREQSGRAHVAEGEKQAVTPRRADGDRREASLFGLKHLRRRVLLHASGHSSQKVRDK